MFSRLSVKTKLMLFLGIAGALYWNSRPRLTSPLRDARETSGFGERRGGFHKGIDLVSPHLNIFSAGDGQVIFAGWRKDGLGNTVIVAHGQDLISLYGHLKDFDSRVCLGKHVKEGDVIGLMGATGRATGRHLHFSVYEKSGSGWKAKDPKDFVKGISEVEFIADLLATGSADTRINIDRLIKDARATRGCTPRVAASARPRRSSPPKRRQIVATGAASRVATDRQSRENKSLPKKRKHPKS